MYEVTIYKVNNFTKLQVMLQVMSDVESVLKAILSLMHEAASPSDPNQYKTGFWGRAQVVSCAMTLLVSWAFSEPQVRTHLFQYPDLVQLLKRLVLDDPEVCYFYISIVIYNI